MQGDWLTLPEAAAQLGISPRTVRRWIKEGKLRAELRSGPYGQQYYVSAEQVTTAQELHDVVRVERPVELAELARALDGYLGEREGALIAALEALHAEVRQAAQRQEARERALSQEFAAALAALKASQALHLEQERQRAAAAEQEAALRQGRVQELEAAVERLRAAQETARPRPWWAFWRRSTAALERG